MFNKGLKDAKQLSLDIRRSILIKTRKLTSMEELVELVRKESSLPVFNSLLDEYEYIVGFLVGLSYLTKADIEGEIFKLKKELNISNISNLEHYYIAANVYFDKGYGKERIVVTLRPKYKGLAKGKTRVPKVKDYEELKKKVEELRDLLEIYGSIEERKYKFFSKIN